MLSFLKSHVYPIGIDPGSDYLKMAQLGFNGKGLYLHAASNRQKPDGIELGSSDWQRWAAVTTKEMVSKGKFKGKEVIAAMATDDMFVDQIKVARSTDDRLEKSVYAAVEQKLSLPADKAMVRYVVTNRDGDDEVEVLVMAAERERVDRHLAIYEKAGLDIKGIGVWPLATVTSYVKFFGRRADDVNVVVMLMDIGSNHSNIIVCRHKDLFFARTIPIGFQQFNQGQMVQRLTAEMEACYRYFETFSNGSCIQRIVFLSGRNDDRNVCRVVADFAQRMQISAQTGDVFAAVETGSGCDIGINRRGNQVDWTVAFGLSLADANIG